MMSMLAVGLFYIAITEIPLADATALIFISPVVVTALSPFLLHENVGIRRWLAVIVGFIGIIFIVQPGFQEFRLGTLASLGAGVIWAFFQIMTRSLAQQEIPLVTVLYTALIGAATMNILLPFYWVTPVLSDGVMLLLMAGFASVGQALLIYAFVAAPAVVVAPFVYVTIIVATATGYIAFGDLPGLMTWVGITVIIASGIYIALREAKVKEPD
jgi:drug/metabolite transporter (DMT)-like permease